MQRILTSNSTIVSSLHEASGGALTIAGKLYGQFDKSEVLVQILTACMTNSFRSCHGHPRQQRDDHRYIVINDNIRRENYYTYNSLNMIGNSLIIDVMGCTLAASGIVVKGASNINPWMMRLLTSIESLFLLLLLPCVSYI